MPDLATNVLYGGDNLDFLHLPDPPFNSNCEDTWHSGPSAEARGS